MELPARLLDALTRLAAILSEKGVKWILAGSTASCLHGLSVEPRDIDIIVELERVYEVDKLLASKFTVVRRVAYSSTWLYSSHYGIFRAEGVNIEVMADLKICGKHGCLKTDFNDLYAHSRQIKINDVQARLAPLEWQLVTNLLIPGKEDRVKAILNALKIRGLDHNALNMALKHAPPEIKRVTLTLVGTQL